MAVRIGQWAAIEPSCVALHESDCEVLALGEDRHRILNPDRMFDVPIQSPEDLARRGADEVWELGSVVPRRSGERLVLDVVVYDLDAVPMVRPEMVERGLCGLVAKLGEGNISRVAMEPIGMPHRGLGSAAFAHALRFACTKVEAELAILLCHPETRILDEIMRSLRLLH